MSELRSVMLFFVGLVAFIVLVAFALGRLRLPSGTKTTKTVATITATVTPTPTKASGAGIFGWLFRRPSPTLTPTTSASSVSPRPTRMVQPTYVVKNPTIPVRQNTVNGVTTIPETGSSTILLALPGILSAAGFWMRKRS